MRKIQTWFHGRLWFSLNFRHEKVNNKIYCVVCIMFGIANKNYVKRNNSNSCLGQQSCKLENIKVCYRAMSKIRMGERGGKNVFPYFRLYLLCGRYSPFMIYLHLWNQLISNSRWSTYYMCKEDTFVCMEDI